VKVERVVGCRVGTEAEEEAVCDRAEAAEGVNNEGDQEGVALIQCANYHFAIYKSTGGADASSIVSGHSTAWRRLVKPLRYPKQQRMQMTIVAYLNS
jgi:hypothetical protein